jgi:hypothetical protein
MKKFHGAWAMAVHALLIGAFAIGIEWFDLVLLHVHDQPLASAAVMNRFRPLAYLVRQ